MIPRLRVLSGNSRKRFFSVVGSAAITAIFLFGMLNPTVGRSQSQTQSTPTVAPEYTYDVAFVKPSKPGNRDSMSMSMTPTPDGFAATNVTLQMLITLAYGVDDDQITHAPNWLDADRFDVGAKMDGSVMDQLQKLTKDENKLARQHMLQALLADRFKLTIHRETKALPAYSLVIAKNGPKLKEAKSGDTYPNGFVTPAGRGGAGQLMLSASATGYKFVAQGIPFPTLVNWLSTQLRRPVSDKTGLTGNYDVTLTYSLDYGQFRTPSDGTSLPPAPDATSPSLLTAVHEQLGLKLESGKGGGETIVIDHVEKPSGN
jgi:uncharacterized protein (TIGR03435 family)